LQEQLN
jgi:chromosome segregation ATPase